MYLYANPSTFAHRKIGTVNTKGCIENGPPHKHNRHLNKLYFRESPLHLRKHI